MARAAHLAASAVLASLVLAPSSFAQGGLYDDFQSDGQIDPCAYSPGQLQNGLNNLPPDLQQYAPGFADQLRSGLEAQCGGGAAPAPTEEEAAPVPAAPTTKTRFPRPPAPPVIAEVTSDAPAPAVGAAPAGSDPPDGLLALIALGAALLALGVGAAVRVGGGVGVGGKRLFGPLGASFADLGGRTADVFAYARDVVRFGR